MGKLLTPEEVCKRYSIKISTLYQWTSKNLIPHLKIRGLIRFEEEALEKWERTTQQVQLV
ncbi:MAG: helix-turn-helix domain-containing protein [Candidatus Omnitrophota bacterium]